MRVFTIAVPVGRHRLIRLVRQDAVVSGAAGASADSATPLGSFAWLVEHRYSKRPSHWNFCPELPDAAGVSSE